MTMKFLECMHIFVLSWKNDLEVLWSRIFLAHFSPPPSGTLALLSENSWRHPCLYKTRFKSMHFSFVLCFVKVPTTCSSPVLNWLTLCYINNY